MRLSELLVKMGRGETLGAAELQELEQKANVIDAVDTLVSSWVVPGTTIPYIPRLNSDAVNFDNDDLILDIDGIFVQNGNEATLSFGDSLGRRGYLNIASFSDYLGFFNNIAGSEGFKFWLTMADDLKVQVNIRCTGAGLAQFNVDPSHAGSSIEASGGWVELRGQADDTTGVNMIRIGRTPNTPDDPGSNIAQVYIKNSNLVVQYNDAGTLRYKYLDLTGTGVTWQHSTTAP